MLWCNIYRVLNSKITDLPQSYKMCPVHFKNLTCSRTRYVTNLAVEYSFLIENLMSFCSITFCGITMKNYVEANISHKSHTTVKYAMKMLSSSSETIIFMFLGVATINSSHDLNPWFIVLTIAFCSVYRAIGESVLLAVCLRLPAL